MFYWARTLLRWIFTPIVAVFLLFEEWGWEPLAALVRQLARLPLWGWCESKIARLPPWPALLTLAGPAVALFPVKLFALYLLSQGQAALGIAALIAAKIVGTAVFARLFQIVQPALMQLAWFARWYPRWKAWKDALLGRIRASATWRTGRRIKRAVRLNVRGIWHKFRTHN